MDNKINNARKLMNQVCVSAFLSSMELIGAIILNTNLNINESRNKIIMVGNINNSPFSKVLMRKDLLQNFSDGRGFS